ncbi:glycosyltransferase family 4 protein [Mucilaginibacter sp.]|uniref:glycosyltransferase family 4 protein n=1 Tax=Mucilaginibacter sp. TaxID=1882438 RepID=UPI003D0B11E2
MKLLALWAPLADYTVACLKYLCLSHDVELLLVYQPVENEAPYKQFDLSFCKKAIAFDKKDDKSIHDLCLEFAPDVVIMSSWNYNSYMSIAKKCREKSAFVVSTFDGQWEGTLKQRLGILISPFFLKSRIDNFFVPGDRQATFARKLGYENPLQGYYSANSARFDNIASIPRYNRFVFVGRLVDVKGIDILIDAYVAYRKTTANPWDLYICGTGPLSNLCANIEGVKMLGFLQPEELVQVFLSSKCLLLPSYTEPWGVVVHEAALAGLSMISSYKVGASTFYIRDGQNGYIVNPDKSSFARAMKLMSDMPDARISSMSATSETLGRLWTVEKWAQYVYENICLQKQLNVAD